MNPMSNENNVYQDIQEISANIETIKCSLRITKILLKEGDSRREIAKKINSITDNAVTSSQSEIDNLFVLKLWSRFEIYLRDYIRNKIDLSQSTGKLENELYNRIETNINYWRVDEILTLLSENLFKESKDNKDLVGKAKQVLEYRNWVAHGCSDNSKPSANILSNEAAKIIKELITLLDSFQRINKE